MQPALGDCVAQLVKDGHTRITVAPLFLAQGGHLKKELPRLLKDLSARHGAAEITVLPPIGEVYSYWEAANGELGFYLMSNGKKRPYRLRCRGACFYIFQAFSQMVKGGYISDAVASLGSLNIVAGELEK